jgi:hypothetical protein
MLGSATAKRPVEFFQIRRNFFRVSLGFSSTDNQPTIFPIVFAPEDALIGGKRQAIARINTGPDLEWRLGQGGAERWGLREKKGRGWCARAWGVDGFPCQSCSLEGGHDSFLRICDASVVQCAAHNFHDVCHNTRSALGVGQVYGCFRMVSPMDGPQKHPTTGTC